MDEVWKTKETWHSWLRASGEGCWPCIELDRLSSNMRRVGVPRSFIGGCQCGLMVTLTQVYRGGHDLALSTGKGVLATVKGA